MEEQYREVALRDEHSEFIRTSAAGPGASYSLRSSRNGVSRYTASSRSTFGTPEVAASAT